MKNSIFNFQYDTSYTYAWQIWSDKKCFNYPALPNIEPIADRIFRKIPLFTLQKQQPLFGAKTCADICPRMNSFPRAKFEENCKLRGTDNVQGETQVYILAHNRGYCVYYPSIFCIERGKNFMNSLQYEVWDVFF